MGTKTVFRERVNRGAAPMGSMRKKYVNTFSRHPK